MQTCAKSQKTLNVIKKKPFTLFYYHKIFQDGYFDPYPEAKPCKYVSAFEANKPKKATEVFIPPFLVPKTLNHTLTIDKTTKMCINIDNYEKYVPIFTKYLF